MSDYYPGSGCTCCAYSESECCCDGVDWRSEREVELEAEYAKLRGAAKEYMSVVEHAMEFYPFKVDGNQLREAMEAGDD